MMAYDPVKAHEYYMKYKKKGLLKGRKKSSKKSSSKSKKSKTKTQNLVGISSSGLNSDGAIEAAFIKERLKTEMNAALAKATTDEEKLAIRKQFSQKANAEIAKLKADPKYAKQSASKTTKTKSESGKSSSSKSEKSESKSEKSTSSKSTAETSTTTPATPTTEVIAQMGTMLDEISNKIAEMTPEQKADLKLTLTDMTNLLKDMLSGKVGNISEWISGMLKQKKT